LTPEDRELFVEATESVRRDFTASTGQLGEKLIEIAMSVE
jgi:TRAP-type C4-dicarboxylate transport system substrate-binding protein